VFGDATLDALITRALADSPDIAMARARITAARAGLAGAKAAGRPQVNAVAGAQRVQQSENGMFGAATQSGAFPDLYSLYSVGADASWELDLFGGERARRRGASAGVEVALADAEALGLSLPAEIVRVYVEHLVVASQLASLDRSLQPPTSVSHC
jgi:outer membrane protein TolC